MCLHNSVMLLFLFNGPARIPANGVVCQRQDVVPINRSVSWHLLTASLERRMGGQASQAQGGVLSSQMVFGLLAHSSSLGKEYSVLNFKMRKPIKVQDCICERPVSRQLTPVLFKILPCFQYSAVLGGACFPVATLKPHLQMISILKCGNVLENMAFTLHL